MITFKEYLAEASRTTPVHPKDFFEWADQHASGYLNGGDYLFRGIKDGPFRPIKIGNSLDFHRKSRDGQNLLLMWMDESPEFKGKPKRSRSFICTTNRRDADGFGGLTIVVPADNCEVGIVGESDIFGKFVIKSDDLHLAADDLDRYTVVMFRVFELQAQNFSEFETSLKAVTAEKIEAAVKSNALSDSYSRFSQTMHAMHFETLYDMWLTISPRIFDYTSADSLGKAKGEIWVQGEAAFIDVMAIDEIEDALIEWAQKYPKFLHFIRPALE